MKYPLLIRPEAERDVQDIQSWYEAQKVGLGIQFILAVDEVLDRVREMPQLYAAGYRSVRRVLVHRFPYVIHYRFVNDFVEVLAVQHGRRHPTNAWIARLD